MTSATLRAAWSLRRELSRILLLAALLPVLVFGVALLWSQWQRDRSDLLLRLGSNAQLSANAFDDVLQGQLSGVRLLAEDAQDGIGEPELARLLRAYPLMLRALVADPQGRIVAAQGAAGRPAPRDIGQVDDRDWFAVPRASGAPHVSDAYRARIYGDEALVAVSTPLLREGRFAGVLQASIPIERIVRVRSDNLQRRGFELLLLDRRSRVVHASAGLRRDFLEDADALARELRRRASTSERPVPVRNMSGLLADGSDAYVTAVLMRTGWVVAIVSPQDRLFAAALSRFGLLTALVLVTTAGILFALWRLRRVMDTSMGRLVASLHGYALGGTLDPKQLSRMPEELQPLAAGIGELAGRMNAAFDDLRRTLDEREHVIGERTALLRQAVSDLDRLSRTDGLTGSLNYRGFQEAGAQLWQAAKASAQPLAVLALDIDHFKRYNDMYGHGEGDGALRRFAGAVRSALLHADDVLARPGGEEFTVFLPGSTLEQARRVGERVCQRVRAADIAHAGSPKGRMTVSVGVAALEAGDADIEDMLKRADAALYRAKQAGRDGVSG